MLVTENKYFAASAQIDCPETLEASDPLLGGGGISSVGGGGDRSTLTLWKYAVQVTEKGLPKLIKIKKTDGGNLYLCLYDNDFSDPKKTPRLVATVPCAPGSEIDASAFKYRVSCLG